MGTFVKYPVNYIWPAQPLSRNLFFTHPLFSQIWPPPPSHFWHGWPPPPSRFWIALPDHPPPMDLNGIALTIYHRNIYYCTWNVWFSVFLHCCRFQVRPGCWARHFQSQECWGEWQVADKRLPIPFIFLCQYGFIVSCSSVMEMRGEKWMMSLVLSVLHEKKGLQKIEFNLLEAWPL